MAPAPPPAESERPAARITEADASDAETDKSEGLDDASDSTDSSESTDVRLVVVDADSPGAGWPEGLRAKVAAALSLANPFGGEPSSLDEYPRLRT